MRFPRMVTTTTATASRTTRRLMPLLKPDLYYTSVHRIDLELLRAKGVTAVLVDLDNTLLPRTTNEMPDDLRQWAHSLHEAGFRVCLVSNNWHERVSAVADELGFSIVAKAIKPLPFAFMKALGIVGAKASQTAMIGDQLFTDILGGGLMGMTTILVEPLSDTDLPHTLMLRRLERVVLAGMRPSA